MTSVKFISLNCRGLNDYKKRVILYDWVNDIDCDVLFLQETHFVSEKESVYNSRWNGTSYHCFSNSSHSKGVSILISSKFHFKLINQHRSADGRIIVLNIEHNNETITLANLYAPNTENDRVSFFKKVSKWISMYCMNENNIILVGDFNCSMSKEKDKSLNSLKNLLFRFELLDLWQKIKPKHDGFTWCDGSNSAKSRIDYIFLTQNFCYRPDNIYLRRPPHVSNIRMSDHIAIIFKCEISSNSRGKGYWKLNTSVLHDLKYCEMINQFLLNLPNDIKLETNPKIKWELIKLNVKYLSIEYCKEKSRNMKQKILLIENELEKMESEHYLNINMTRK